MKSRSGRYLILGAVVVLFFGFWSQYFLSTKLSPQEWAVKQLSISALSPDSVWDQEFLAQEPVMREKLVQFEKGELCKSLKELDNKKLTHQQMLGYLKEGGFACIERPLAANPSEHPLRYLKIDNTITQNLKDKGIAYQEICWDRRQPECAIRIKRDGFPLNRRSMPHSSKAVLRDGKGDPGSYQNEAFKVASHGQALPKGPSGKFGLRKCPYHKDKQSCDRWVDAIMEEAHPPLKEPMRTK